jgi:hypothetical protein
MKLSRIQKDIIAAIRRIETKGIELKDGSITKESEARLVWSVTGSQYTKKQFKKAVNRMIKLGVLGTKQTSEMTMNLFIIQKTNDR